MKKKTHIFIGCLAAMVVMGGLLFGVEKSMDRDDPTSMVRATSSAGEARLYDEASSTAGGGEPIPGEYIVRTVDGDFRLVKTDDPQSLKKDPNIVGVEQNRKVVAFGKDRDEESAGASSEKSTVKPASIGAKAITGTDVTDMQYGDRMVRAPEAWEVIEPSDTTVRVAVIDTGVDANHPDLAGKVIGGTTIVDETAAGNRYEDDGKDDNGHGTHVAGIIAATVNNSIGINGIMGPVDIEILPIKALNDAGEGSTYDIIEGIRYAADNGASIMNLSLGSYTRSDMEAEAVEYAQNKGCLIIAAAGNDSFNVQYTYPASYEGVVSVGSVDSSGNRSYFSNFGDTLDVSAPGSDIVSTMPETIARQKAAQGGTVYGDAREGYYMSMSGTSMATPHAVGVAALYKAANPMETGFDIASLMIETCQDVGDPGKDTDTGAGIVDASAMLGGEIVKTPLLIRNPVSGQEVYEKIDLSAQINPTMGIKNLRYYLDEETDQSLIADIECDSENAFYHHTWDTTTWPDGEHTLIASVYDQEGNRVGEAKEVPVKILNSITNGFTLQVSDPEGTESRSASYYVYQKETDGYTLAGRGRTSDLGYARVKGLSEDAEEYILIVYGTTADQNSGNIQYVYRRLLTGDQRGTKISVDGSETREVAFATEGEDGEPLESPYLKIYADKGNGWLSEENAFRMQSDTRLFLDDAEYKAAMYSSADRLGTAYYIEKELTVTGDRCSIEYRPSDGTRLQARYPENTVGEAAIKGVDNDSEIPFLSGVMYGSRFYLTQGKKYTAEATIRAVDDSDNMWSLRMEKADHVVIDEEKEVYFIPQIKISDLKCEKTDIYVGDRITAESTFGDVNGDKLLTMMGHFPVFKIYRVEGDQRELVYEKESRWNADAPSWDSSRDYKGNVPPSAGNYVAELSFDAGPFGGRTSKEFSFVMQTKSGKNEMSSTIKIEDKGISYKATRAELGIYTQNGDKGSWKKATEQKIPAAGADTGVIQGIGVDDIELASEGSSAAVVTLKERKKGYDQPERYLGFSVVPFRELKELEEITIDAASLKKVNVRAVNMAGTDRPAKLLMPIMSSDEGTRQTQQIGEFSCNTTGEASGTNINIPDGIYPYLYGTFSDSREDYVMSLSNVDAGHQDRILLDGRDTVLLDIEKPAGCSMRLSIAGSGVEKGPVITPVTGKIRTSKGQYDFSAVITDAAEMYRYNVRPDLTFDLNEDGTWKIGPRWQMELAVDNKIVRPDQDLTGRMSIKDPNGNIMTDLKKMDEDTGNYVEVSSKLTLSKEGGEDAVIGDIPSDGFTVTSDLYSGEGTYELRSKTPEDTGFIHEGRVAFAVRNAHSAPLWKSKAKLVQEWVGTGKLRLSWDPGDVIAYDGCNVAGYRIYYSTNGIQWEDITGEELIKDTKMDVDMGTKTPAYWYRVEAVDEVGSESTTGPQAEVLGQYPVFTIINDKDSSEREVYTTDLSNLAISQAMYSARNNYGADKWYAVEGIYLDDLINGMGFEKYSWISVRGSGLDPFSFKPDDIAGNGYYFYPKSYDGESIKEVQVKPMVALGYAEGEGYEPAFDAITGYTTRPRLFFGQQFIGDVTNPFFAKDVDQIIVYGAEDAADSRKDDIDPETPTNAAADSAKVDSRLLPRIEASGIGTTASIKKKTMTVSFKAVKNAVNYRIYYRSAGAEKWSTAWTGSGKTRYVLRNMRSKGLYEFKIAAYAKRNGAWVKGSDSAVNYRYFAAVSKPKAKAGKKRLTASWKRVSKSSGYQVIYSLKKNMNGSKIRTVKGAKKKKVVIKKLKKKRYYVQVRPYKTYKGKKYIGVISTKKVVKVK